MSEKEAIRHFSFLLEIINYMHDQGVCHRDINPNNLILEVCMHRDLSAETNCTASNMGKPTKMGSEEKKRVRKQSSLNALPPLPEVSLK